MKTKNPCYKYVFEINLSLCRPDKLAKLKEMNMKLFSFFVGAATAISASAALAEFNVTILHTNDISRIESINKYDSTCNADGEAERKCFGGIARIKSAIDMQRSELSGQNILVLDAGDPFQGSLFLYNLQRCCRSGIHGSYWLRCHGCWKPRVR